MKIHKIANDIASDHNMTPEQRSFSRDVQREAYQRLPETCDRVREILTEAQYDLMNDLEIDPAEIATVDAVMSRAFQQIRDDVTQVFRTEQMRLINRMQER
jgi:hypothetical protein